MRSFFSSLFPTALFCLYTQKSERRQGAGRNYQGQFKSCAAKLIKPNNIKRHKFVSPRGRQVVKTKGKKMFKPKVQKQ